MKHLITLKRFIDLTTQQANDIYSHQNLDNLIKEELRLTDGGSYAIENMTESTVHLDDTRLVSILTLIVVSRMGNTTVI